MILAAGLGTRMRPLTLDRAKPVLPVLDRPLLHWTLEMLAGHGVKNVMINLHYLPRTVRAAVGDGRAFGLDVSYSFEREILGTGGGPRKVRRLSSSSTATSSSTSTSPRSAAVTSVRAHPRPWPSSRTRIPGITAP